MRRLLLVTALSAVMLVSCCGAAGAISTANITPNGAITATGHITMRDSASMLFNVVCRLTLEGELRATEMGTLGVLGSLTIGEFARAAVSSCTGGTMSMSLTNAVGISAKEITNRGRVELYLNPMKALIETAGGTYRCLYEMLMRATTRENPFGAVQAIVESLLPNSPVTLMGSEVCPGQGLIVGLIEFTFSVRTTTVTLS